MSDLPAAYVKEDLRYCQARLKIILDTLPVTILLNPLAVILTVAAMALCCIQQGFITADRIAIAIGAQVCVSVMALAVYRRWRNPGLSDVTAARRTLIVLQGFIGLCWGVVGWCLWKNGNAANNGLVVVLLVMSLWALALTRCAVRTVFLTGVATAAVPMALRFATSSDSAARVFLAFMPMVVAYVVFTGMAARQRVNEMLKARFANEDLSRELAVARDEAVKKRLEAEEANASKTAFLANMSHELRTPLNAIIGFSEIIATKALGEGNPRYPEYANDIHASGSHLLTLINEILDVAKIEAGRMEIDPRPLDMVPALDTIERIMAIRCEAKELKVRYTVEDGADRIVVDERAFRQILLNLISNAVKFTPQGGDIHVACRKSAEGVVVSVNDTGPGIPADKLALLFQPFSQVDNRFDHHHGGTGLGLALVQGLARLHGGRAWIESEVGRGTSVFVYFPLEAVKHELTAAAQ
jgi:Signal transduction histidine kinase